MKTTRRVAGETKQLSTPPEESLRRARITTIHERLSRVRTLLLLITAAENRPGENDTRIASSVDYVASELRSALVVAGADALEELYWVERLSESIGRLPAPTDDDIAAGVEPDDFLRARMREMVGGAR